MDTSLLIIVSLNSENTLIGKENTGDAVYITVSIVI